MTKRDLILIVSLSITLFLVNLFFNYQGQERNREWKAQQEVVQAKRAREVTRDVEQRLVPAEKLPLVALYADVAGDQRVATGVQTGNAIIVLAWESSLPAKLYARPAHSSQTPTAVTLAKAAEAAGLPAVYASGPVSELRVGELGTFGVTDLQLVTLTKTPTVALGEFREGYFNLPADKLPEDSALRQRALPDGDAIALLKTTEGYLPVGVYAPTTRHFTLLSEMPALGKLATIPTVMAPKASVTAVDEEKFYVLEDGYQQLVFSNRGGALVEINLPFASKTDEESVVKEIEIDREMVEFHPRNARFPARPYYSPAQEGQTDFVEHQEGTLGGYYPLLRRDLVNDQGTIVAKINPHYYATNLVSEYPEVAELTYKVTHFDATSIVFEGTQNLRKITKTYSLPEDKVGAPYTIDLEIAIDGDSRGLWLTSGIPEVELFSGTAAPSLKYRLMRRGESEVEPVDPPKDTVTLSSFNPNWVSNSNGFFGLIMDPLTEMDPGFKAIRVSGKTAPSRLVALDSSTDRFKAADLPGYEMLLPLKPSAGKTHLRLFAGPFAESVLKTVDATYSDPATGYNPDYLASQSFHGWFSVISTPFAKFLFILMKFFHAITGSWGFSIILLTVALRLMLYPLNAWSTRSMVAMQKIAPEVAAIQEKNKKDPKKAQLAIMTLYREKGVNPLSGCLPLIIQLPFLIGMFDLLKSTFELRGASFIPGWIDNLAAPDVLFSWTTPIFFIGNEFHLLPVLLGVVMFLQQRLMYTGPADPKMMTDQQRQQRAMGTMMTVVFTVMFYHFPSGLNIYWLSSMLLGILQQWYTAKTYKPKQIA